MLEQKWILVFFTTCRIWPAERADFLKLNTILRFINIQSGFSDVSEQLSRYSHAGLI
ncbi:hypothetical protein LC1Hm_0858 [Halomicrobium sp. LC1Hm]|nr:hypothetical protein LC1Hm_0858 [Halomicrobium sp. LC1Hm]